MIQSYTAARPGGDGGSGAACGGCHGTTSPDGQADNANLAGAIAGDLLGEAIGDPVGAGMVPQSVRV